MRIGIKTELIEHKGLLCKVRLLIGTACNTYAHLKIGGVIYISAVLTVISLLQGGEGNEYETLVAAMIMTRQRIIVPREVYRLHLIRAIRNVVDRLARLKLIPAYFVIYIPPDIKRCICAYIRKLTVECVACCSRNIPCGIRLYYKSCFEIVPLGIKITRLKTDRRAVWTQRIVSLRVGYLTVGAVPLQLYGLLCIFAAVGNILCTKSHLYCTDI